LILARIRAFDNFDEDNDPHGEHDFGLFEDGDVRVFWKIDYYDREMELMSSDPADPFGHDARPHGDAHGRALNGAKPGAKSYNWSATLRQSVPKLPLHLEWAPWAGRLDRQELTIEPGFRRLEAHG
jgi:hypothetical protein